MKFKFTMDEQFLVYVEVHCSTIVKLFTNTGPDNEVVLCFDAKISLHISFSMSNVNALINYPLKMNCYEVYLIIKN